MPHISITSYCYSSYIIGKDFILHLPFKRQHQHLIPETAGRNLRFSFLVSLIFNLPYVNETSHPFITAVILQCIGSCDKRFAFVCLRIMVLVHCRHPDGLADPCHLFLSFLFFSNPGSS